MERRDEGDPRGRDAPRVHHPLDGFLPVNMPLGFVIFLTAESMLIVLLLLRLRKSRIAERELRDSEAEFRALAESMPQVVWVAKPDGENVYFNRRWVEYTGQTLEESYGDGWIRPFHPDDRLDAMEAWQDAIHNGAVYSIECRLRAAQGAYSWWLIRGVPILDGLGVIHRWFGTCTDITSLKESEEKLMRALDEKEILLHELFHRANNNMQVISALLGFQADSIGDARFKQAISEVQDRILSMALVNQQLHDSRDLSKINLRAYIEDLSLVYRSSKKRVAELELVKDMEDVFVPLDYAIPCGLIINELFANVYRHAYPDDVRGIMEVFLRRSDSGTITLRISDRGVGVSSDFERQYKEKLGINNVLGICVNQLHGEARFETKSGLACRITFKDSLWKARIRASEDFPAASIEGTRGKEGTMVRVEREGKSNES
jgi:PAS domain S-box-containing protein